MFHLIFIIILGFLLTYKLKNLCTFSRLYYNHLYFKNFLSIRIIFTFSNPKIWPKSQTNGRLFWYQNGSLGFLTYESPVPFRRWCARTQFLWSVICHRSRDRLRCYHYLGCLRTQRALLAISCDLALHHAINAQCSSHKAEGLNCHHGRVVCESCFDVVQLHLVMIITRCYEQPVVCDHLVY